MKNDMKFDPNNQIQIIWPQKRRLFKGVIKPEEHRADVVYG